MNDENLDNYFLQKSYDNDQIIEKVNDNNKREEERKEKKKEEIKQILFGNKKLDFYGTITIIFLALILISCIIIFLMIYFKYIQNVF